MTTSSHNPSPGCIKGFKLLRWVLLLSLLVGASLSARGQQTDPSYAGYLFAYFVGNGPGQEQVHYAISDDGLNYRALNGNRPVLDASQISSTGGVRDPHILRGHDGKTFYMVLTDLYVPKMGWNNTRMVMLRSEDLVNWESSVVDLPAQFPERFGDVNRVWAPQTIYDEQARRYMVYFSMKQANGPDIIYYAYANDDFTGLATTPTQLYFPPNPAHACIDADIVPHDGKFYLFFKGEGRDPGIRLAVSDRLTGGYTLVSDERIDLEKAPVEGSGTFRLNDRDAWVLMYDVYTRGRYQFAITEDLRRFKLIDEQVTMDFHPRHGSVLPITTQEMARLREAYAPRPGLLADADWQITQWTGGGNAQVNLVSGRSVYAIESAGADMAWSASAPVKPNTLYELSGWIRTEGLKADTGRGALLNIHTLRGAETRALTGNNGWTRVRVLFNSGNRTRVQVNCLFGGWGQSRGKAWFADLELHEVTSQAELGAVRINASRTGPEMSELIYSQFIEHMGRCIYGGIWAEMLEDRKFYFPITAEYAPYINQAMFPVVGRSPWEILGPAQGVTMVRDEPFVGDHDPRLGAGSGIRQHDLGVVRGASYTGYVWLLPVEGRPTVTLTLDPGDKPVQLRPVDGEYGRYAFSFTATESTDQATLTLAVDGGAVRVGTLSLMPADNVEGMRADTLALLRQLKSPLYRWPGGNFVSGYDWRDGIGDRDRRPPRTNPAWTGVEHNDFGMHEFIRLCELIDTEPLITINMGFEGLFSAQAEMEYANGGIDTPWGARRAANGRPEPFDIKYWCIGNEMWGTWQLGFMQPQQYQVKHNWVVDGLRKDFPNFVAISSGNAGDWSRGLLEHCADRMDMIAEHFYCQHRDNVTEHVNQITAAIRAKAQFHRQTQATLPNLGDRRIPIAMTEWNYWYGPHPYGELGTVYYLRDALGIAAGLNEYARCSDIIGAAFYAQTVNVIGCIKTTRTEAFLAMTALPLIMYREHFGTIPIPLDTDHAALLGLDIAAAWTADRTAITVAVVNSNPQPATLDLDLVGATATGKAHRWWFAGEDPDAVNTADQTRAQIQHADGVEADQPVQVPGYSATIFVIPVQGVDQ